MFEFWILVARAFDAHKQWHELNIKLDCFGFSLPTPLVLVGTDAGFERFGLKFCWFDDPSLTNNHKQVRNNKKVLDNAKVCLE